MSVHTANLRTASRVVGRAVGESSARRTLAISSRVLAQSKEESHQQQPPTPAPSRLAPLSPSAPPRKQHSALTIALVKGVARLMGYNSVTTTAIRVTSDLFDRCAERADLESEFWYGECQLPRTYQVWFQITALHIHLLLTRFRALPTQKKASAYSQEIINHFFIDAESRMRVRFGVQTSRLVKGYMREMHTQHRGAMLSLDEALAVSAAGTTDSSRLADADTILATALWRNIFGAGGWGQGVGGVKRKVLGIDRPDDKKSKATPEEDEDGMPELAQDSGIEISGRGAYAIAAAQAAAQRKGQTPVIQAVQEETLPTHNLQFAVTLQKLVSFYRRESVRLASLSDEEIQMGRLSGATSTSVASFGKI